MSIDFARLVLLGILSTAIHWTVARASITKPFWSRAKGWASDFLRCAGCCGFWIGLALGAAGLRPVSGLHDVLEVFVAGLLSIFATPVAEGVLVWGLSVSAIPEDEGDGSGAGGAGGAGGATET